jgi:arylsulfatase A-like enzyme
MALFDPKRTGFALPFAIGHWCLLVLIQCENVLGSWTPQWTSSTAARWFLVLPLLQTENLLASLFVGLVAFVLSGRLMTRWLMLALWVGLSCYLVLDQVYYKTFFDHFRPSSIEGAAEIGSLPLLGSIVHELDLRFCFNSIVVIGCTALLAWRCVYGPQRALPARPRWVVRLLPAGAAVLLFLGIPSVSSSAFRNVQHHPLLVLADDVTRRGLIEELRDRGAAPPGVVDADQTGSPAQEQDRRLAAVLRACRGGPRPPNVLLIVLESVGSLQLLSGDGLPPAQVTPHLAKLAQGSVVFDSIYSVFPATVRTHVAMTTGGLFPTGGSVYELLDLDYQGPTLPRAFGAAGYDTALFAGERLDGENMHAFMRKAGYRTFYDFADDRLHHTKETVISPWGAQEEFTIGLIDRWLDAHARTAPGPFFLNYLTAATHHPYGVPDGYSGPFPGDDSFSRYRNALHYTDAALGKLFDALAQRGLLDETIIAVTGDHGQAFGTTHPLNFTHRNRINEENVKSFLMLVPPARRRSPGPVVSHRVGSTGDIMPTLLAAAGCRPVDVPGRNLCSEWFTPQPVFFHKNMVPEQWGLRDGNWKFIGGIRNREQELYDLANDPTEQMNLAGQEPDRVQRYDTLCQRLFCYHDEQFVAHLQGYRNPGGSALSGTEVRVAGPKRLAMGVNAADGSNHFVERSTFDPHERPVAYVRLVAYDRDTPIEFRWCAPSGTELRIKIPIGSGYCAFQLQYAGTAPMEPGDWTLSLHDPANGSALLTTRFYVRQAGPGGPIAPRQLETDHGRPAAKVGASAPETVSAVMPPSRQPNP